MAEHALNYRGMTYLVGTSLGWDCGWTVFVDGEAACSDTHEVRERAAPFGQQFNRHRLQSTRCWLRSRRLNPRHQPD